ncbi:hypothetical protein [Stigmatella aurantiaca]|uniref:Amidohydrolase family protein n=1 Tax=Stigmatella aurantiaca (strain DW4/3-1) TaxID=378806 RepID=Q099I6_STIAD|nr:hypothetical protein [Stigmatella aurantiaca]EAU68461.1 amidohydrolase family protein [Stigmatella aurantiaca DW4/3-1]
MTKARVWVGLLLLWMVPTSEAATERSSVVILGKVAGHQQVESLPDGRIKVHFEYNDRGRGPSLDTVYQVGANGTVTSAESQGVDYLKAAVQERYTAQGTSHAWKNSAEDEQREVPGPVFYLGLHAPPEETVLLVRAALRAPGQRLALLPSGEVQVSAVATQTLKGKSSSRKVRLYALSGVDLEPSYVWLDEDQRFFASGSSWSMTLREGFENTQELLLQHQEAEQGRLAQARAKQLTTKLDRPLAITHARVFDPGTLEVAEDQTVLVAQGRITAVASRRSCRCLQGPARWMPRAASSCRASGTCTRTSAGGPMASSPSPRASPP